MNTVIDIAYDMRTDSDGRDPDKHSRTLRSYHKILWSKQLPNGKHFDLLDNHTNSYLYYKSDLIEFFLTSDTITHEYMTMPQMNHVLDKIPKKVVIEFLDLSYTIWGFIIFPGKKIDNKRTINQGRGCHPKIRDRMDLTLECIRLYYIWENSPLWETIRRYSDFFDLFESFQGYCEHFLLQDLVNKDWSVKFHIPHNNFTSGAFPTIDNYIEYKNNNMIFLTKRNDRIKAYSENL